LFADLYPPKLNKLGVNVFSQSTLVILPNLLIKRDGQSISFKLKIKIKNSLKF